MPRPLPPQPSEGCIARVTDRAVQSTLEVELSARQERLQDCLAVPMTVSFPAKAVPDVAKMFSLIGGPILKTAAVDAGNNGEGGHAVGGRKAKGPRVPLCLAAHLECAFHPAFTPMPRPARRVSRLAGDIADSTTCNSLF